MELASQHNFALPGVRVDGSGQSLCAGSSVELCSIINIRSLPCSMDCAFCGQNRHSQLPGSALMEEGDLLARIGALAATPVAHIGLVATGGAMGARELQQLCGILEKVPWEIMPKLCVSLGRLPISALRRLKDLGIRRYHHNLETSREFYPHICTTQSWEQRAETVASALASGLEVCSGALFGIGESWADRSSLAQSLKELGIKYIPLNFLNPRPNTALSNRPPLAADEALRIIGLFRQLLPEATLRVCGGRSIVLGKRQKEIFPWGANALMTGDYLTTKGEALAADLRMLQELGLVPA